jgi:hypothetical protein
VPEKKRQGLLTVRVNDVEMRMVQELADAEGVGMSDYVRNLVRTEHALTFGRTRAKKSATKKRKARR